jgi:hypothetical protein
MNITDRTQTILVMGFVILSWLTLTWLTRRRARQAESQMNAQIRLEIQRLVDAGENEAAASERILTARNEAMDKDRRTRELITGVVFLAVGVLSAVFSGLDLVSISLLVIAAFFLITWKIKPPMPGGEN